MALDKRSRHQLHLRLEETLGPDGATTLMEHLPPVGWADVATKRDLDALEERLGHRIDALDERLSHRIEGIEVRIDGLEQRLELRFEAMEHKLMAAFRGELQTVLTAQGRHLAITLAGTAGALSALSFAAARLT